MMLTLNQTPSLVHKTSETRQKTATEKWGRLTPAFHLRFNIDEGSVKVGIRMAVGYDQIADFTVDNYAALKLKRPQKETCFVPEIVIIVIHRQLFTLKPHRHRLFFNLRVFRPQGTQVLPQRL